jgi:hypothetical protein
MGMLPADSPVKLRLEGIHSTSGTRCTLIKKEGWRTGDGRVGTGVYFWKKGTYWDNLARGWHAQMNSEHRFDGESKPGYCGLKCALQVDENDYLNLDQEMVQEEIAKAWHLRHGMKREDLETMCGFYNGFLTDLEAKMKTTFRIIERRVAPPKPDFCSYPRKVVGDPGCYIVRDPSCISILN